MLITRLKSEETITSLCTGKVFIINCHGCKEVGFPEEEAKALQKKLQGFLQRQAFPLRQGRNMGLCVSRKGVQGAIHLSISFADRCKY